MQHCLPSKVDCGVKIERPLMNFSASVFLLLTRLWSIARMMGQVSVSLGVLVLVALYTYQSKLIYPASLNEGRGHCALPSEYDMANFELLHLQTEDGEILQCYLLKHDRDSASYRNKTILILSPNAGNIGHSLPIVSIFYKNFGYNVFIYSYRGYGKSTGSPSEKGLKIDAQRIMKYLMSDEQYRESSNILYGRSLGGAVAVYIAANMSTAVQGVILENTFLSIRKTVPHIFPFLRYFTSFVHQKWDLESLIEKIPSRIPLLMLSARNDEIVPPSHMDILFALSRSEDKMMYKFENCLHNDTILQEHYWARVHDFLIKKVNPVGY